MELHGAEPAGAAKAPEVIARMHVAGFGPSSDDGDGRTFKEIWNLPATVQLRQDALDKLAANLSAKFQPKAGQTGEVSRLLRPLLNDLADAEICLEVIEHPQGALESTFALRLDEDRNRVWQTNWNQILARWALRPELRIERFSFLATNSWVAIHGVSGGVAGSHATASEESAWAKIIAGNRPVAASREYWARIEADLARWSQWLAGRKGDGLPRLDLTVSGRKEYVRSQASLRFQDPLAARVEEWSIPMNTIRDPLISFTAVQGLSHWLQRQSWFRDLGLETAPNQFFLWGLSQTAFQIQGAVPAQDVRKVFDRIADRGAPRFNRTLAGYAVGKVLRLPDRPELVWRGLPLLVPYLGTVTENGRGYLHGGLFPVDPPTNAPPPLLFQQLTSQTNLLYYDWELTQAKLAQLRPMLQVAAMFLTLSPMSTNSSASKWLDVIEPRLGNTVTEVSMISPRELQLTRTSHAGLTGLELLGLANWIEGANFPRMNFKVGFQPVGQARRQQPRR